MERTTKKFESWALF